MTTWVSEQFLDVNYEQKIQATAQLFHHHGSMGHPLTHWPISISDTIINEHDKDDDDDDTTTTTTNDNDNNNTITYHTRINKYTVWVKKFP